MIEPWEARSSYLGDGVYATFDGFHVWLVTDRDEGPHRIALEPAVLVSLVAYVSALRHLFPGQKVPCWEALAQAVAQAPPPEAFP